MAPPLRDASGRFVRDTDKGYKKLERAMRKRLGPVLVVGVQADDADRDDDGPDNVGLAAIHEFGSGPIPARSFLRSTFDEQRKKWLKVAAATLRRRPLDTLNNQLGRLGAMMAADVKNKIADGVPPPLKDATIKSRERRGFAGTTPLIESGQLKNSITWAVKKR